MRKIDHPVITGQTLYNSDISGQNPWYFNNWYWSTHGYFNNLPSWAIDVIDVNNTSLPTYIDYAYGKW